ncbi:MAG: YfhO family protein [Chloroflexi bacterium]|nr:YfhO family protein [Chloroflexota bacterium]
MATVSAIGALWAAVTAALFWLRRRSRWPRDTHLDLLAAGILAALTLGFFWRPLVAADVWMPADGGDLVSFLYPLYRFVAGELQAGRLPLWNPHLYSGAPFIGDAQAGILYPVNVLAALLLPADFPYSRMQWLSAFHFFVAGLCMYACLRWLPASSGNRRPLRRVAALAGAVAWMFSDLFVTHFGNLNMIAVFAWLPLVFVLFYRGVVCERPSESLAAGVVLGLTTLAGHLQMTVFIALALALAALYEWLARALHPTQRTRLWRPWLHLGLCGAVSVGLAAPVLWPAAELARFGARSGWSYAQTVDYSLSPPQLLGLLVPQFFGRGPALHWGLWPRVESGYLGILPLVLAAAALLFRRHRLSGLLTALAVVALLLALGIYAVFHGWLTVLAPVFGQLRASARFVGLLDFALAALAAIGLDALLAAARRDPNALLPLESATRRIAAGVWLVPLPLAYAALLLGQGGDPQIVVRLSVALIGVAIFALAVVASWAWLAALRAGWLPTLGAGVAAVALIFAELASNGAYMDLGTADPSARFGAHPALVSFLQADDDLFRIDTRTDIAAWWQPSAALVHGLQDVGGVVNPLELAATQRYWEGMGSRSSALYDLLNVRYLVAARGAPLDEGKFDLAFEGDPDLLVYRNRSFLPRAFLVPEGIPASAEAAWTAIHQPSFDPTATVYVEGGPALGAGDAPAGTARVAAYSVNRMELEVDAAAEAYLFLSEVHYPGWQATVDGQAAPIYRANSLFRAVPVPAGQHQVRLVFAPRSWLGGCLVAGGTILALAAWGAARLRRRRRQSAS